MTTYTRYFRFAKPDFDADVWHTALNSTLDKIDSTLVNSLAAAEIIPWENSTAFVIGNMVIDEADGSLWVCEVAHTSVSSPTTFASTRASNPTYWAAIALNFQHRGAWANATAYRLNDIVYDTPLGIVAICAIPHTSSAGPATIDDDAANWTYIIQLATTGISATDVTFSATHTGLGSINVQEAVDDVFDHFTTALALKAALSGPTFTGVPAAPTAAGGTNTTQLATTAFVAGAIATLKGDAAAGYDTLGEIEDAILLLAPLASPTFTGNPAAPTASPGDNDTSIATTAFVQAAIAASSGFAAGTRILFHQTAAPTGWTKETGYHDFALRVVNGTVSAGGAIAFSTVFSQQYVQTVDPGGGTVSVSGTITVDAANAEQFTGFPATGNGGQTGTFSGSGTVPTLSHTHNYDLRTYYVDVIIAQKN